MLRLTPKNDETLYTSTSFGETYGGAEANVISSLANFGHKTRFFTKMPNNELGKKALRSLKIRDVDVSNVIWGDGRLGIYFLENGHGVRNSKVIYDRSYSSFAMMKEEEIDFEKVLRDIDMIHVSGITPALGLELKNITLKILKYARENGITVSYDSNFRSKLWSNKECGEFLAQALEYVDIAFLGDLDLINLLNFDYTFSGEYKNDLKNLYNILVGKYKNIKYIASTKRDVISANRNSLVGYFFENGEINESKKYEFDILDRVGGGDAFSAGILHSILTGKNNIETIEFAVASSILKHTYKGDTNQCDENDINLFLKNGTGAINR